MLMERYITYKGNKNLSGDRKSVQGARGGGGVAVLIVEEIGFSF